MAFSMGVLVTLLATVLVLQTWSADAASRDDDATLVPITPCRLVDTRQPGQSPLGDGQVRTIEAHGTNGPIAGAPCTIPADAVGLSMNVTALDATTFGTYITIWQDGVARPEVSSLNPAPGQPPTPNAVTTPLSPQGKFNIYNFSGTVQILVDVNGYYTKTSLTELASRLAAVEAELAAGVDPAVLARIAANEAEIAANTGDIAGLHVREPFAVTARDDVERVTATAEVVVSVDVEAPVTGRVTVISTTHATEPTAGNGVICSLNQHSVPAAIDNEYSQMWDSSGPFDGMTAQLAGTRVFDITGGVTATYELVCEHFGGSADSELTDSVLSAIFTLAR